MFAVMVLLASSVSAAPRPATTPARDAAIEAARSAALAEVLATRPDAERVAADNETFFAAPDKALLPCWVGMEAALVELASGDGSVSLAKVCLFHRSLDAAEGALNGLVQALAAGNGAADPSDGPRNNASREARATVAKALVERLAKLQSTFSSHGALATPKTTPAREPAVEAARNAALAEVLATWPDCSRVGRENESFFDAPEKALPPRWEGMEVSLLELVGSDGSVRRTKVTLFHDSLDAAEDTLAQLVAELESGESRVAGPSDGSLSQAEREARAQSAKVFAKVLAERLARAQAAFASHDALATPEAMKSSEAARRQKLLSDQQAKKQRSAEAIAKRKAEQRAEKDAKARSAAARQAATLVYAMWERDNAIAGNTHFHTRRLVRQVYDDLAALAQSPSSAGVAAVRARFDAANRHLLGMINDGGNRPRARQIWDGARGRLIKLRNLFESQLPEVDEPRPVVP